MWCWPPPWPPSAACHWPACCRPVIAAAPHLQALCQINEHASFPVLATELETFDTARQLTQMSHHVPVDDLTRMERVVDFVAERLDLDRLISRIGQPGEARPSPPAFRYQLIQHARHAGKRIVLPEGDEPRTVEAAVICHQKGIACRVPLAKPEAVCKSGRRPGHHPVRPTWKLDPDHACAPTCRRWSSCAATRA